MNTENPAFARRADLDALRAGAMLLGIALHASLSFFPSYWMVTDTRQSAFFGILFSAVHGFRMPLFFVMSGYFSAMLLHRRGRGALIRHRFRRVFLPLLVGLFTVVPLTMGVSTLAMSSKPRKDPSAAKAAKPSTLWEAARAGDLDAIERHLKDGAAVNAQDPDHGGTPLMWAAIAGRAEAVERLIERGADVNAVGSDGGTALIGAAFLGHVKTVDVLIQHGADVNLVNKSGSTALDTADLDEGTTRYFASILQLELDEKDLAQRKSTIAENLRKHGAVVGNRSGVADVLMQIPLFNHLWFLWFLWWLVMGYAVVSAVGSFLPAVRLPSWLVLSPARYVWLIPLTMVPQWFMAEGGATPLFGPDTSSGLLPIPHVFAYYAIFFGFGALDFSYDDGSTRIGRRWALPLALGLLVVLPLALALIAGWSGPAGLPISEPSRRAVLVFLQASYPWLITFGLMGLFRRYCPSENATMRYLSDSAYWLYLAHLPLIVAAQLVVKDWPIPAVVKFALIVTVVTAFLLWTYQTMVRYTWVGRFLNGPRTRPSSAPIEAPAGVA
ncbi:MAG: acyltransferase family protein [Isosphaeraceae bacterium]